MYSKRKTRRTSTTSSICRPSRSSKPTAPRPVSQSCCVSPSARPKASTFVGRSEMRVQFLALALLASFAVHAKEKPKPVFVDSAVQSVSAPPSDKAQIVFLEPINKIQGLFPVGLYEIDGDNRTLRGITAWKSKTAVLLPPGKHLLYASQGGIQQVFTRRKQDGGLAFPGGDAAQRPIVAVDFVESDGK